MKKGMLITVKNKKGIEMPPVYVKPKEESLVLSEKITRKFKKDYIIAYFYTPSGRYFRYVLPIDTDSKSFTKKKGNIIERYVIDRNACRFYTEKNEPIYFYFEGVPNPLIFNFEKDLEKFVSEKRENVYATIVNDDNKLIDVYYSSIGLEMFKNDESLKQLHNKFMPEHLKIIFALIGLVSLAFIVQLFSAFFR